MQTLRVGWDFFQSEILGMRWLSRLIGGTCHPFGGVVYSDFVVDVERCSDHAINIAFALSGQEDPD